jgi:hypothetical protein
MGQLGSAMGNPVTFEKDPQNFSGAEWGARLLGGGIKGLSQGINNYQNQQQGIQNRSAIQGLGMGSSPQQQTVDPSYFQPQQRRGPNNLNFYGEGY